MIRDLFRSMPPLRHDRDPAKSQVLAHIMQVRNCDPRQAENTFHYLRRKGHVAFKKAGRIWVGSDYTPEETEAEFRSRTTSELNALRSELSQLKALVKRIREAHNSLVDSIED